MPTWKNPEFNLNASGITKNAKNVLNSYTFQLLLRNNLLGGCPNKDILTSYE